MEARRARGGTVGRATALARAAAALAALAVALAWPTLAAAQMVPSPPPLEPNDPFADPGDVPAGYADVTVEQNLESQLPLDARFTDSAGRTVELGEYFDGERPVLVNLSFFECPATCPAMWQQLAQAFNEMGWTPGREFRVVTISISPTESPELAAERKRSLMPQLAEPRVAADGWSFLVGEDASIDRMASAAGFGYKAVPGQPGQYVHQTAVLLVSPDGRVMRYMDAMRLPARTLRLSLVEASQGQVGSLMDQVFLFCSAFDPESNSYKLAMGAMRIGGLATLVLLGGAIALMAWVGKRRREAVSREP